MLIIGNINFSKCALVNLYTSSDNSGYIQFTENTQYDKLTEHSPKKVQQTSTHCIPTLSVACMASRKFFICIQNITNGNVLVQVITD